MGKADELLRSAGGNIAESAAHRGAPVAMPTPGASTLATARLDGVVRSKTALDIPLAKIVRDPSQPREEFDEEALGRLAESVRGRGVLQPIRVRWDEAAGKYIVICGERRWRASQMAGLATIPCVVSDRELDAAELLAVQLVENALREDLRPVEQAKAYRTLMTANGWSGNQLAKELGISQPSVVQALALLDLPATVQNRVESGDLPASTAYAIASIPDPAEQAEVAEQAVAGKMSRAEVVRQVRERATSKGRGAKARPKKTSSSFRAAGGAKVTVEHRKGVDDDLVREALRDILDQLNGRAAEAA
jgi:ParB family chromosome partitioning protein